MYGGNIPLATLLLDVRLHARAALKFLFYWLYKENIPLACFEAPL
jgi:hypothetical protein